MPNATAHDVRHLDATIRLLGGKSKSTTPATTTDIPLYDTEEAAMDAAVASERARPVIASTPQGQFAVCSRKTAYARGWKVECRLWGVTPTAKPPKPPKATPAQVGADKAAVEAMLAPTTTPLEAMLDAHAAKLAAKAARKAAK